MKPVCMHGKVTDIVGPLELSQVREWIKFHQKDNSKCTCMGRIVRKEKRENSASFVKFALKR